MRAHSSFAGTSLMLTFMLIFMFCYAQLVRTHMSAQKTRTNSHTRRSSSPALSSVLKVRFVSEISPALPSAPSCIMLVFHKITKDRFVGFKSRVTVHLKSLLRGPIKSRPTTRLKSSLWVLRNVAKARFAGFQIPRYQTS